MNDYDEEINKILDKLMQKAGLESGLRQALYNAYAAGHAAAWKDVELRQQSMRAALEARKPLLSES